MRLLLAIPTSPPTAENPFRNRNYLEYTGKDDEALQEVDRPRGKVNGAWPATLYALALHRRGRFEDALEVLDGLDKKAVQAYHEARGRYEGASLLFQHTVLYLLGQKNQCHATADCCQGFEVS